MIYTLKITIIDSTDPIIWRKIKVNSHITFEELHFIIQTAFGWRNEHLFCFRKIFKDRSVVTIDYKPSDEFFLFERNYLDKTHLPNDGDYEATEILLSDFFKKVKDTITYEYDFGDSWEHKIVLEEIEEGTLLYPTCVKAKGKTPPENCGGIWGYNDMLEVLLFEKPKSEYNNIKRWLKECCYDFPWNKFEFNLDEVNQQLIENTQNNFQQFKEF